MNETTINILRVRKKGGGRKSILATRSGIDEAFLEVLKGSHKYVVIGDITRLYIHYSDE